MKDGTMRTVDVDELPLELPATTNFKPSDNRLKAPSAHCTDWLSVEIDGVEGNQRNQYDATVGWKLLVLYSLY